MLRKLVPFLSVCLLAAAALAASAPAAARDVSVEQSGASEIADHPRHHRHHRRHHRHPHLALSHAG